MFLKKEEGLPRVAHDHSNHAVIDGVTGRNRINVDFRATQGVTDAGERSRAIIEKEGQLVRDLHMLSVLDPPDVTVPGKCRMSND